MIIALDGLLLGLESLTRYKAPTEWDHRLLYVLNWLMWNTCLSLVDCRCLLATNIESGTKRKKEKNKKKKKGLTISWKVGNPMVPLFYGSYSVHL